MVDRDRLLAKLDEMRGYVAELRSIAPATFEQYQRVPIKRACERLIQIAVECVIDVCQLLVSGRRLGLPAEESDLFDKLEEAGTFTPETTATLRRMRGCRNILVHEYGSVSDVIVFDVIKTRIDDFDDFDRAARDALHES